MIYIVNFKLWYGASSMPAHEFIQIFDEEFETKEEAKKRLKELKKKFNEKFLKNCILMDENEITERLEEDEDYKEKVGEGTWFFPKNMFGIFIYGEREELEFYSVDIDTLQRDFNFNLSYL